MCCLCKAWYIHRISAVSNSIQRIKFSRNSTSDSAAAFLPHVRLVLSHYPTEMRHRFKRRVSAVSINSYIMLIYGACVTLAPPKKNKKLGHSRPNATWTYHNTYCCIVILLLLVLVSQNLSALFPSTFVRHIEYSMLNTFSADRQTQQYQFKELNSAKIWCLNQQSHFCRF